MAQHNEVGKLGEDLACKWLESQGFRVFDRNYKAERAEVDIVAYWENPSNPAATAELHFVEVKTLSTSRFTNPENAVDSAKLRNMAKVAQFYCWERQLHNIPAVFDVISVVLEDPSNPEITHFEDAWRPETKY
ncbi:MAG: YraN family protein [Bacteroidetes bacterium]|nr:YraN family protein [Bacteroidota bacterium]MBL0014938.1 YraN family protein [Bacteroidota bacterium]